MAADRRRLERLSPRLRMIANGNAEVNASRAQLSGSVTTTDAAVRRYRPLARLEAAQQGLPDQPLEDPPDLVVARSATVSCFVQFEDPNRPSKRVIGAA